MFLWEAGWVYTKQEALDLDLTGDQAFGAEGSTYAKAERLGAYWLIGRWWLVLPRAGENGESGGRRRLDWEGPRLP